MKKVFFLAALLPFTHIFAQQKNTRIITSTLTNATVYYGFGAELNHTVKTTVGEGLQEIIIENIATDMDPKTIQVACPESIALMSYRFNVNTEAKPQGKQPQLEKMQDTAKLLQKQQAALQNDYATTEDLLNRTTKLIESNVTNNPKKEISSEELIKLVTFYTTKVETLKNNLYSTQLKKNDLAEKINDLNNRIIDYTQSHYETAVPKGQIILQLMAKSAAGATFDVSYFTTHAGWMTTYDMRIKSIDNSFKLGYKASVTQTTGIDWKDVKLTLNTGNPNQNANMPVMNPWYLNMYVPVLYNTMAARQSLDILKKPKFKDMATGQAAATEEDEAKETNNVAAYTNISESRLNTSFEIDLPYDIPADGKAYSVAIKEDNIKADYKHYAAPKLDNDAFLIAEISDWESLQLLPGEANIIMDNVYLGKSFIDPYSTKDTLSLSLGRDKRITLKRTLVKDKSKNKVKAENKIEAFVYDLVVKNNKKQAVDIQLQDQYPVSNAKEIEVTLDNDGNGKVNKDTGIIEWNLKLQPGESKTIRFGYTVKYPKTQTLQNLR